MSEWIDINENRPESGQKIDVKLFCDSVLTDCIYQDYGSFDSLIWGFYGLKENIKSESLSTSQVVSWRPHSVERCWRSIEDKDSLVPTKLAKYDIKLDCGSVLLGCDRYGREFLFGVGSSGNEIFVDDADVIEWRPHVELPEVEE